MLLGISFTVQAATEVIALDYLTASDVLPTAQSVLGSEGRANVYGNQLIVSATPEKIAELRSVIRQLDTQPRRLLITLDTTGSDSQSDRGYAVNGSASIGNVEIEAGRGEINGKDQVRIINNKSTSRTGGVQQVQATEGYPALIQIGQSVPLRTTSTGPYGQVMQNTQYQNVTRGFLVTATVSGDRVNLSIRSNNDSLSRSQPGVINVQSTDTRVNGLLGQWISLGGVSNESRGQDSGFLQRSNSNSADDMSMRIKVEVAP
jgi:type II secretory pathway component GspD/PulD (secretin)